METKKIELDTDQASGYLRDHRDSKQARGEGFFVEDGGIEVFLDMTPGRDGYSPAVSTTVAGETKREVERYIKEQGWES